MSRTAPVTPEAVTKAGYGRAWPGSPKVPFSIQIGVELPNSNVAKSTRFSSDSTGETGRAGAAGRTRLRRVAREKGRRKRAMGRVPPRPLDGDGSSCDATTGCGATTGRGERPTAGRGGMDAARRRRGPVL